MKKTISLVLVLILAMVTEATKADFVLGTPENLGPTVNTVQAEGYPSISADSLSLYFWSDRPGGYSAGDLWVATRASVSDPWGPPVNLGATVNSSVGQTTPNISADGLSLYFASSRDRGGAAADLYVTTRATLSDPWGPAVSLGSTVNSSAGGQGGPSISADGLSLYFASDRPGGYGMVDLWVTTRATLSDPWGPPANLGRTVNSDAFEANPSISADDLAFFFEGGSGYPDDIWVTRRLTVSDPWGLPVNLGPRVNLSVPDDATPNISADGSTLYFCSDRPGGYGSYDMWQAAIIPIVDFNGDGLVDSADMCIMVDHWVEDYSLCDIGPMPWGDGIVDVQDLIILAEHFLPVFAAHWKLDETEGEIACDTAGDHDAMLQGNPVWRSTAGKVGGAVQFDGIDDYANAGFVLNPSSGPFSILAWIKGGMPGQVIISQMDGTGFGGTWLGANQADGKLVTNLMYFELASESVITDDQWHHVGLVWNGSRRSLYVDGQEIASDDCDLVAISATGNLYIGADKNLEAGTFFSGLIDDVRIYNRALSAEEIATLAQ
jgi:hypothetical protein